jgi:Cu+-exporting ATPase
VLIVACPCALALSIPFTYGTAQRYLGKAGLYLKNAQVIEDLAGLNSLVFDKTGTITLKENAAVRDHLDPIDQQQKLEIAALCRSSTHPLSQRLYAYYKPDNPAATLPLVINFTETTGKGIEGKVNNNWYRIGSARFINASVSSESRLWVEQNGKVLGYLVFENHYRPGLFTLLENLRFRFSLHLISGDNPQERQVLEPYFNQTRFSQSPHDKREFIQNLQAGGKKVLMLGDGLNDAGALATANVGVSISDDVYQFTPASDAILASGSFNQLLPILDFTRKSKRIVYGAFALSFLYNIVGISFAASGLLTPLISAILMPLSSVTVVAFCSIGVKWLARNLTLTE